MRLGLGRDLKDLMGKYSQSLRNPQVLASLKFGLMNFDFSR